MDSCDYASDESIQWVHTQNKQLGTEASMTAKSTHFKVDNGDMTLIQFESGHRLLIDCKIRVAADDPNDDTPDVASQLKERLLRDDQDRLYVDAFLLTHPDKDHCSGLANHFHLGAPSDWSGDKIIIREMWSSPVVFRRANKKDHVLCDDARAWAKEARRRVKLFRAQGYLLDGDSIKILGEDVNGKTDDIPGIVVRCGHVISSICGQQDNTFNAFLIAPLLASDDEEDDVLSKNNSSVILQLTLAADGNPAAAKYLVGGDAEVAIWEKISDLYHADCLKYHVLLAPHHCSWHSLSWDSWSEMGKGAKVSPKARKALSQAEPGATILASSAKVKDDENDPPCIRAKQEYVDIVKPLGGTFRCLADESSEPPFELTVTYYGPKPERKRLVSFAGTGTAIGSEALGHG